MTSMAKSKQSGVSLVGLIFILAILGCTILGCIGVLALKVVPTVTEFMSVKRAIALAKQSGNSIPEIRQSFDKQADTSYIESVTGKDLDIVKTGDGFDVGISYEKKIPLVGPASLAIDYEYSTSPTRTPQRAGTQQQ